ncbi:MAG TPA: hypothetical protein VGO14_05850 [Solirubrobacteraceae bacterium]|nr:hypothetical protein [Solirubrobacteraceae bacterium]
MPAALLGHVANAEPLAPVRRLTVGERLSVLLRRSASVSTFAYDREDDRRHNNGVAQAHDEPRRFGYDRNSDQHDGNAGNDQAKLLHTDKFAGHRRAPPRSTRDPAHHPKDGGALRLIRAWLVPFRITAGSIFRADAGRGA